jgi:diadenosine tetraphosphate (Ap4A) HIT family hydrolase
MEPRYDSHVESSGSPLLSVPTSEWVASNELAFALRDKYPVTPGHMLVIPRRLVASWFDATREEQQAILQLVDDVKQRLDAELHPDGYNVGFNVGEAAGQTCDPVVPNRSERNSMAWHRLAPVSNQWKRQEPARSPIRIPWHQTDMVRRSLVRRWCANFRRIWDRTNAS